MTLRHLEGFEGQRRSSLFPLLYAVGTGGISSQTGYRGQRNAVGSGDLLLTTRDLLGGAADQNTWIVGWAMRMGSTAGLSASATVFPYLSFLNASGEQLRVEFIAANEAKPGGNRHRFRVMRGATELATSNEAFNDNLTDNAWLYFEFEAVVRTGANGSFSARYHTRRGSNFPITWNAASTGVNTANQGADGADRVSFSLTQVPATNIVLDDIYVCDGAGAVNNAMLGPLAIEAIDVSGNGDTVQWDLQGGAGSLASAWSENPTVDIDELRVNAHDVGFIELAALTNPVNVRSTTIVGTQYRIIGRMEATGTRDVQFFYRRTTGTPAQIGTAIVTFSDTTQIAHADTRETDPNTGSAWVVADLDGLQIGVELDA